MSDSISAETTLNRPRVPRGRPVGTGIDDRDRLARIVMLMNANPGMRPTTAIRALGITDTSAIRRLRDKLKSAQHPQQEAGPTAADNRHRTAACPADSSAKRFRVVERPPLSDNASSSRCASPHLPDQILVACLDATIRSLSAAIAAHQAMMGLLLQNPLFRIMLGQHIAANELAMALVPILTSPRRTI